MKYTDNDLIIGLTKNHIGTLINVVEILISKNSNKKIDLEHIKQKLQAVLMSGEVSDLDRNNVYNNCHQQLLKMFPN